MLKISQRGQVMPPSPIRKLVPFAEAAKKKGIKVFHLNIGQPDIETPPAILDVVRQFYAERPVIPRATEPPVDLRRRINKTPSF